MSCTKVEVACCSFEVLNTIVTRAQPDISRCSINNKPNISLIEQFFYVKHFWYSINEFDYFKNTTQDFEFARRNENPKLTVKVIGDSVDKVDFVSLLIRLVDGWRILLGRIDLKSAALLRTTQNQRRTIPAPVNVNVWIHISENMFLFDFFIKLLLNIQP